MEIREKTFDLYWKFAVNRQEIFFKRFEDKPPPWSDDSILNTYKFCNAYRASDRVSQYLIKNVIYKKENYSVQDIIFRIILFKIFNKSETWEYFLKKVGNIRLNTYDEKFFASILSKRDEPIYSGAYMSCANKAYGYDQKHENHLAMISDMISHHLFEEILSAKSFKEVFDSLKKYPLVGNFMAYQLATDINYSEVINFDENSFTIAGPGAIRGIQKCFIKIKSPAETIHWMVEHQEEQFSRLGLNFRTLWGRPLKAIDCQNLFCEVDKYCRVALPDLTTSNARKKIKSKIVPNPNKIEYFYPPKWGINDKITLIK